MNTQGADAGTADYTRYTCVLALHDAKQVICDVQPMLCRAVLTATS